MVFTCLHRSLADFDGFKEYSVVKYESNPSLFDAIKAEGEIAINWLNESSKMFHVQAVSVELIQLTGEDRKKGKYYARVKLYETACRKKLWSFEAYYDRRPCPCPEPAVSAINLPSIHLIQPFFLPPISGCPRVWNPI